MVALAWLSVVFGVLGIGYGVYVRNHPRPGRVVYFIRGEALLPSHVVGDLTITFQGSALRRLSRCVVGIGNQGPQALEGQKIAKADPIEIRLGAATVTGQPRVTHSSHSRISPSALVDGKVVLISFELFVFARRRRS